MKVFLTDDHDIIFSGYERLLSKSGNIVVGTSKTGIGLINWLRNNTCDVILLDLGMPDMNGIDVLKHLFDKENVPNILIVSGSYDVKQIQEAIILGAKGFILKDEVSGTLEEAILKISKGRKFFSDSIMDQIILKQLNEDSFVKINNILSDKEAQALDLMIESLSSDEICEEMNIKKGTLRKVFQRIRNKIGVRSNIELIKLSMKHNFKR